MFSHKHELLLPPEPDLGQNKEDLKGFWKAGKPEFGFQLPASWLCVLWQVTALSEP